jgi:hypothetical protein
MKEKDFRRLSAQKVVDFFNSSPYATRNNLMMTEGDLLYEGSYQGSRGSRCYFRPIADDRNLYEVATDARNHTTVVRRLETRSYQVLKGY